MASVIVFNDLDDLARDPRKGNVLGSPHRDRGGPGGARRFYAVRRDRIAIQSGWWTLENVAVAVFRCDYFEGVLIFPWRIVPVSLSIPLGGVRFLSKREISLAVEVTFVASSRNDHFAYVHCKRCTRYDVQNVSLL